MDIKNKFLTIQGDKMQNSYQFIHFETYADVPRKNSKRPSAEAVARECQRTENSYPHITSPQEPILLYGVKPLEALEKAKLLAANSKDRLGRKIRKDAQIIGFGVASIKVESTLENWHSREVQLWVNDTKKFLKEQLGDSFVSLEAHLDERWIHLHFGATPKLNDDGSINLTSFHPGLEAQRACKSTKKSTKDYAYKSAMRTFQDNYYASVSLKHGQLRFGPKRRRLSRAEWYAQRNYAALLAKIFNTQNELIGSLKNKLKKAKVMLREFLPPSIFKSSMPLSQDKELNSHD